MSRLRAFISACAGAAGRLLLVLLCATAPDLAAAAHAPPGIDCPLREAPYSIDSPFYSAVGHRPESYSEPHHVRLLEQAITWAAGAGTTRCRDGQVVGPEAH
jgi:hypothetical protein